MLLSQIYHDASNSFAQDPELRELLRATFANADADVTPFDTDKMIGVENGRAAQVDIPGQFNMAMGLPMGGGGQDVPKSAPLGAPRAPARPGGVTAGQITPRADPGLQFQSQPIPPEYLAQIDQLYQQTGGVGVPGSRFVPGAPQAPGAAPPGVRPIAPPAAPPRNIPDASVGNSLSAFLSGLGSSDAILPAIGGGMQAVENLDRTNKVRNQTLRALINRGLDEDTALAAVNNPELMKTVLPRLFGGKMKLGKVTTTQGDQSVFYDEYGNVQPIKGSGPSPSKRLGKFDQETAKNNAAQIKDYKTAADSARETLSNLNQLEKARESVSYEGVPGAGIMSTIAGLWGEGGGENVHSLGTKIQLGFTDLTKGAVTDKEMGIFAGATPALGMSDAGARPVMAGMKAGAQRTIERSKFYQQWVARTGGNLTGADEAWDQFINQNLILGTDPKTKELTVNTQNIGNWQRYLPRLPHESGAAPSGGASGPVTLTPEGGATPASYSAPADGPSPADYGEEAEGMEQLPDGRWVMPDPEDPSRMLVWEPPS